MSQLFKLEYWDEEQNVVGEEYIIRDGIAAARRFAGNRLNAMAHKLPPNCYGVYIRIVTNPMLLQEAGLAHTVES